MNIFQTTIVFFLMIGNCAVAGASPFISATSEDSGRFVLDAKDLKDVTFMEINVGYEAEVLSNPVVSVGSVAQRANTETTSNQPGSLTFTISREKSPFSGSGVLANLSFTKAFDLPGKLTYLSASCRDSTGAQYQVGTSIKSGASAKNEGAGKGSQNGQGTNSTRQSTTDNGSGDVRPRRASQDAGMLPVTGNSAVSVASIRGYNPGDKSMVFVKKESVLERFWKYSGDKSPSSLKALFRMGNTGGIRQEPAVALSDGRTRITVSVRVDPPESRVSSFTLLGAHLTALKYDGSTEWVMELLPDKGKYEASVTVATDAGMTEYPLTIAPLLTNCQAVVGESLPKPVQEYIVTANGIVSGATCASRSEEALPSRTVGGPDIKVMPLQLTSSMPTVEQPLHNGHRPFR